MLYNKTIRKLSETAVLLILIMSDMACSPKIQPHFAELQPESIANYHEIQSFKLQFRYEEDYLDVDKNLTYQIFDQRHQLVMSDNDVILDPIYGDNRFVLDTSCCLNCFVLYTLVVSNQKKEKEYLRFRINIKGLFTPCASQRIPDRVPLGN